ncbi:fatty acyl-CoA reductase wat-like [Euwallacea similis]|uniref:fatty acyl-CoA reductase wat-like n=1 Tax=Euwallacea similis TaxID=1736056 RepID=UPI00344DAF93
MTTTYAIKQYYNGKNIFLTGGTGFLGKFLIEKLLRSTNVEKIYVLIRPKKELSAQERIDQMFSSKLFEKLRELKPESVNKIVPIIGDCLHPGLGISTEDRNLLIETVQIVFHAAATIRFDDFLKSAILTNLRSARDMAYLALEMKNIEVFLHVSTAYCNIEARKIVDEVLYPPFGSWKDAIELAEQGDSHIVNILTQKYIENFPNTYTYTKRLTEHCINEILVGKIPTIICRPSIVIAAIKDPIPGYIDNFNGPVGLHLAGATGLLRSVYGDIDIITDHCFVDNIIKLMLVSIWEKGISRDKETITIYHANKSHDLRLTYKLLLDMSEPLLWHQPFDKKVWFPGTTMTKSFWIFYINVILFHVFPALVIDLLLWLSGHTPFIFKLQKKIYISNMAVHYFTLNEWTFRNEYFKNVFKKIPKEEISDSDFMIQITTKDEFTNFYSQTCHWVRVFLLKEKEEISDELRTKTLRMYYLDKAVKAVFFGWLAWTLFIKINILEIVFGQILTYWQKL